MDSTVAAILNAPVYEDFEPSSESVLEKDCDTIILNLPGFRKDHLKVQLTTAKLLRISGSRETGDNKWSRFEKEFPISTNIDTQKISAKFEGNLLYVKLPKMTIPIEKPVKRQDSKLPASAVSPPPQTPSDQPPPQKSSVQEQATEKPAPEDDSSKQTDAKNVKEEPKVEPTDSGKKTEKYPEEKTAALDDIKKKSIAGDKQEDDSKEKSLEEKTSGLDDIIKRSIADEKREDDSKKKSPDEKTRGLADSKKESTADDKHEDDSKKAAEKREKENSETVDGSGKSKVQNYKERAVDVASKLKKYRSIFNLTLVAIFALAFGLYITNFIRSLKRDEA